MSRLKIVPSTLTIDARIDPTMPSTTLSTMKATPAKSAWNDMKRSQRFCGVLSSAKTHTRLAGVMNARRPARL